MAEMKYNISFNRSMERQGNGTGTYQFYRVSTGIGVLVSLVISNLN